MIASGFSETERVKELQSLGAGAYIIKPLVLGLDSVEKQVNWFRKTEPTEEYLVAAMEIYEKGLESNPKFYKC